MTRRLLAALFVTAVAFALTVRADDPKAEKADPKKPGAPAVGDVAPPTPDKAKEEALKEQFETFKQELLKYKNRLSSSDKEEDKNTVKVLESVLKEIDKAGVDNQFKEIITKLQDKNVFDNIDKIQGIEKGNGDLREAIHKLIDILQSDTEDEAKHKLLLERIKLAERLKELLSKEERLISKIDLDKAKPKDLLKDQGEIKKDTKATLDPNAGKEPKNSFQKSEAKYDSGKEGKDARGEAKEDTKDAKGDTKPSDAKDGDAKDGKPSEAKDGDAKDGKPSEAKDGKGNDNKDGKPSEGKDDKGAESKDGKPSEAKENKGGESKEGKPSDSKDGKGGDNKDAKPGEGKEAGKDNKPGDNKEGKPSESKGGDSKDGKPSEAKDGKGGEGKPSESKDGKGGEGKDSKAGESKDGKGGEGKPGDGKEAGKPTDPKGGDGKPGDGKESGKPGDAKSGESKPGDGSKAGEGKGNEGKPSDPKGGDGKPGSGKEAGKVGDKGSAPKPGELKGGGKPGDPKGGDPKPGSGKEGGKPGDAKSGDPKGGEGKPSESKPSDSKGKGDGKGDAKPGDSKSSSGGEGKPSESKGGPPSPGSPGQPQPGQPSQGKGDPSGGGSPPGGSPPPPPPDGPNPRIPVKKQIEDAVDKFGDVEDKLKQEDKPGALPPAGGGADKLRDAIRKLEEIINADRQEEIERILEKLQNRCQRILAMQIAVRDGTVKVDSELQEVDKLKGDRRRLVQDANVLSDREGDIVKETDRAIALLENEGSAIAFAEVFHMVRKDMVTVQRRLGGQKDGDKVGTTDTGNVTQAIENDIIKALGDMVDALKKQREANKNQPPKPPGPPGKPKPPGDQDLVDLLSQLKMVRNMQKRVNERTELYGKEYPGSEQVPSGDAVKDAKDKARFDEIRKELDDLAGRQEKTGKILKDIATGRNNAN